MAKTKKKTVRIQKVISGAAAELYENAISGVDAISFGIIKLAQDQALASTFFGDADTARSILSKYGIKQNDLQGSPRETQRDPVARHTEAFPEEGGLKSGHHEKDGPTPEGRTKPRLVDSMYD